jgi:hypothetical protein
MQTTVREYSSRLTRVGSCIVDGSCFPAFSYFWHIIAGSARFGSRLGFRHDYIRKIKPLSFAMNQEIWNGLAGMGFSLTENTISNPRKELLWSVFIICCTPTCIKYTAALHWIYILKWTGKLDDRLLSFASECKAGKYTIPVISRAWYPNIFVPHVTLTDARQKSR